MRSVYSTRFSQGEHSGSAVGLDIYTCPAGHVGIVKDFWLTGYSSGAAGELTVDGVSEFLPLATTAAPQTFHFTMGLVFNAGEKLHLNLDAHRWAWYVSGYLLTT